MFNRRTDICQHIDYNKDKILSFIHLEPNLGMSYSITLLFLFIYMCDLIPGALKVR